MQLAIVTTLIVLLGCGGVILILDARQRRLDRRVAMAMPASSESTGLTSIRRQQVESRWRLLHSIINYRAGLAYELGPMYVAPCGILAAVAVFYANFYVGFPLSYVLPAAVIAAVMTARTLFGWQRNRFTSRLFRQIPDVVALVTSTVRSGLPVSEAFQIVARDMPQPTAGQFAVVCDEMRLGRPPEEALYGIHERSGVAEYGMFAVTLGVQMKAGGRLSETLQILGDTVRERVAMAGRARALAGEVIFSARALSLSPVIVGGGLYLINPGSVDLLFYDPTGRMLLAYAVGSVLVGVVVIRWMVRRGTTV
jgi:tight adherence protein B